MNEKMNKYAVKRAGLLSYGEGEGRISANLFVREEPRMFCDVPQAPAADTLVYAVCRFMRRNPEVFRKYILKSYHQRLSRGAGRRGERYRCAVDSRQMELPAGRAVVRILVAAEGITVEEIWLCAEERRPRGGTNDRVA